MIPEVLGISLEEEVWQEKRRAILHARRSFHGLAEFRNDLERTYSELTPGSTYIAHNGVDPVFTRPSPEAVQAFRARENLARRPYLLMVGERIGYGGYKNGWLAFRALAELAAVSAPTLVCVGGHQEIEPELRALAPKHDVRRLALSDEGLRTAYGGGTPTTPSVQV